MTDNEEHLDDDFDPEDYFTMMTILPKKKIKVKAHLENKDGEKILLKDIAKNLNKYVFQHLSNPEVTPVNSQLFPLMNDMMVAAIPRASGMILGEFMLMAPGIKNAIAIYGLQVALLMRYIQQHDLKIVTTETQLSDEELNDFMNRQSIMEDKLSTLFPQESTDDIQ